MKVSNTDYYQDKDIKGNKKMVLNCVNANKKTDGYKINTKQGSDSRQ